MFIIIRINRIYAAARSAARSAVIDAVLFIFMQQRNTSSSRRRLRYVTGHFALHCMYCMHSRFAGAVGTFFQYNMRFFWPLGRLNGYSHYARKIRYENPVQNWRFFLDSTCCFSTQHAVSRPSAISNLNYGSVLFSTLIHISFLAPNSFFFLGIFILGYKGGYALKFRGGTPPRISKFRHFSKKNRYFRICMS